MKKKFLVALVLMLFLVPTFAFAEFDWGLGLGVNIGSGSGYGNDGDGSWDPGNYEGYGLPSGSIYGIVANIVNWSLRIFGLIGIVGFVIAGIMYLLAAGDDEMITKAKAGMKWSIVGVVVGLLGLVILQAVDRALSAGGSF
ncbi:MAG: hypothetical protein COU40_00520 [Candidatus Moranbacteria bacterium CG10_big_fil_rev_8_21_14_0_10_35_21]|nr:MAG: hypothetical protein COU40_00520 [Candidatus Moranbacteria bacterium CG10_big_fil_rev_8_21_14_0_10_35_21]PJA88839.1 MAG: hypothetical protein CO139_00990 [Candidatus Moranbacteria bacterium CG_4_9_14_3_um_filter_36_9]